MPATARTDGDGFGGYKGSRSPVAEAFRVLRTNLQFAGVDRELKVVLITSTSPDEGKSTVAQYLAQTTSRTGKKVLVLDADLINPTLHRCFDIPNQRGLSNLIVGDMDSSVFTQVKDYPSLSVITSGPIPPNSSELLGSSQMRRLMDRLRGEFDLIIMDTPPILPVTDAVVASSLADGVILVAQAGKTRGADVRHAQEVLENAHANLLGVVLNRAHVRVKHYYASMYRASATESGTAEEGQAQP
jgi:capsular exopolysaccharide synthesis family protein